MRDGFFALRLKNCQEIDFRKKVVPSLDVTNRNTFFSNQSVLDKLYPLLNAFEQNIKPPTRI